MCVDNCVTISVTMISIFCGIALLFAETWDFTRKNHPSQMERTNYKTLPKIIDLTVNNVSYIYYLSGTNCIISIIL